MPPIAGLLGGMIAGLLTGKLQGPWRDDCSRRPSKVGVSMCDNTVIRCKKSVRWRER